MKQDKAELFLSYWKMLSTLPTPDAEYNFDKHLGRKHRFDFAFPEKLIAVEIEGNAWNVKGGGRHMQNSDLEKYNIAASLGWRVFRFSPSMLKDNPMDCIQIVSEAVCLTNKSLPADADTSVNVDAESKDTTHTTPSSTISRKAVRRNTKNSTTPAILS